MQEGSTSSSLSSRVASPVTVTLPACLRPRLAMAILPQPCKQAGRLEFHPWHPALCLHHLTGIPVKACEESLRTEIRPPLRLQCQPPGMAAGDRLPGPVVGGHVLSGSTLGPQTSTLLHTALLGSTPHTHPGADAFTAGHQKSTVPAVL